MGQQSQCQRIAFVRCAFYLPVLVSAATIAQTTTTLSTNSAPYDPSPWLQDLAQIEDAMATKYANLEWLVFEHETDLRVLFANARKRINAATNTVEARATLERFAREIGDGHVDIRWLANTPNVPTIHADCTALGYDSGMFGATVAAFVPRFQPLLPPGPPEFPAGLIEVGNHRVGVLKIGIFTPQGIPALCTEALAALKLAPTDTCDDSCSHRIEKWASNRMSLDMAQQLRAIKSAGADLLLIDIANNGGGTEWAEAAARMVTKVSLQSERLGYVRGRHWAQNFADLEIDVRAANANAAPEDRDYLDSLADKLAARRREAETTCPSESFWQGKRPSCPWLGSGWYSTGLLRSDSARLRGKPWAGKVFTPANFDYTPGVWRGPVIVLINSYTGSAATEFAAVLQDNRAAVVIGPPSFSGGCGHTNGGTPTTLKNSGGVFEVPDCARFRADGSNEVMGIQPDILVGLGPHDGPLRQGIGVGAILAEAIQRALKLAAGT